MPFRIVQSAQNSRLKELRRALASPGRNENGLVGIEGPNLLAEALRAGLNVRCVFVAQGSEPMLEGLGLPAGIEALVMNRALLDSALATEAPQPVAALVEPPDWTWAHIIGIHKGSAALVVVLAGLQDPGNLGTILRSAEAFGADGVLCLEGTVSAWNSKAVRASAGSVFRMPVLQMKAMEAMAQLREARVRTLTTAVKGEKRADEIDLAEPVALLIGNEGNGVPLELAAKADGTITIPCPGPVESLNAAVATSVLLYEADRQRAAARQRAAKGAGSSGRRGGTR
ncbi:RNA methyltransferase [Telmatobacter sp. DSM 110680]|uniref:RNA methyltransferase n=1 Tax=Telmatobacter sp. DSM 110680 TaxID=3036704 RepID=A0AAU7DEH4_9BACT